VSAIVFGNFFVIDVGANNFASLVMTWFVIGGSHQEEDFYLQP
jgi:hypothetical protein